MEKRRETAYWWAMPSGEDKLFDEDFLTRLEHVRLQMRKRFAGPCGLSAALAAQDRAWNS